MMNYLSNKIIRSILFLVSLFALIISTLLLILILFGIHPFYLQSDSMEPSYKKDSFVLVNTNINPNDISIGDVLVYRTNTNALVMHRLVGQDTMQGDANNTSQQVKLTTSNLIGKTIFKLYIPELHQLISVLHNKPEWLWLSSLIILLTACIPFKTKESNDKYHF